MRVDWRLVSAKYLFYSNNNRNIGKVVGKKGAEKNDTLFSFRKGKKLCTIDDGKPPNKYGFHIICRDYLHATAHTHMDTQQLFLDNMV